MTLYGGDVDNSYTNLTSDFMGGGGGGGGEGGGW